MTQHQAFALALADYRQRWPKESVTVAIFQALWLHAVHGTQPLHPYLRSRLEGHFTGSAWLVDRSGTRVLLTHHRKLDRWLQLGGHADGEPDLAKVALKEAHEESGLTGLHLDRSILDLDRHWIPERADVPGHWHYDVRYVVRASNKEDFIVSDESHALAWRGIADIAVDATMDASLRRMAAKWLALTASPVPQRQAGAGRT